MAYFDLTDARTYDAVVDALTTYGADADVVAFAFSSYWCNEDTLDHLVYYYGLDLDDVLNYAGIQTEDEDED